jgi:hypothetical protein
MVFDEVELSRRFGRPFRAYSVIVIDPGLKPWADVLWLLRSEATMWL